MRKLPPHINRKHPILTGVYAVFTPAIDQLGERLGDWIDSRITGAYVYGPSRFGKTRAVRFFLKKLLEERFGEAIPLHVWSRPFAQKSPSELYRSILDALHHGYGGNRAGANDRLNILTEYFIAESDKCDTNAVYLIIDEAQDMTTNEWHWLLAIQNELDSEGYSFSVFSIASHQMAYQFDLLSRTGNPHVGARFLVDHWAFPGIQSVGELEFILDGYDTQSQWPRDNGVSYLQHFAPKIFERNKRLASCADSIWECLIALLPEGAKIEANFPMKHLALATQDILLKLASGDDWEDATSQQSWLNALTQHRLADHMRAISIDL